jgi:hypothetical protein
MIITYKTVRLYYDIEWLEGYDRLDTARPGKAKDANVICWWNLLERRDQY